MTSRDLVKATLAFENKTGRAPRQLWVLPWAQFTHPDRLASIRADFPDDIVGCAAPCARTAKTFGDPYEVGEYIDEWGCRFQNIHRGVIGEVKEPIIRPEDENWEDLSAVHVPEEWLSFDVDAANAFCRGTDKFVLAGCCPRPFEQLQFLRGTEQLYVDLMLRPANMMAFIKKMHAFYCELMEKWAKTEVDALNFMDDWGAQKALLINPLLWEELFKPMYRDYIDIAHRHGKKIFMHSDGNTEAIYPHLTELGLDAFNSQMFCIGVDKLAPFKGKITFWGEIDRQHLLPEGSVEDIRNAVALVRDTLWQNGGCIAQCEFGPGARPENVYEVFKTWNAYSTQG